MINIRPITDLRYKFSEIEKVVKEGEPVYLTKNGYGSMVLLSIDSFAQLVDRSVVETLGRTINSTVTTLITIVLIYILGVNTIKEFALPLMVGILVGTYSSVCLTGAMWFIFRTKFTKGDSKKEAKKEAKN